MSMLIYTIMKKQFIFPVVAVLICGFQGTGQTLSNLRATCNDPLFTTYAAPPERSSYQNDQAYQFLWFDPQSGTEMISTDGPNAGMAFTINNRLIFKLQEFQREPVISVSYSDLVKFSYYPVKDLGVEVFAAVYSSQTLFMEYRLVNEGRFPLEITLLPYLYFPATDSINRINHTVEPNGYIFPLTKKKDGWMEQHDIPFIEHFNGYWGIDCGMDSTWSFCEKVSQGANPGGKGKEVKTILRDYFKTRNRSKAFNSGLVSMRTLRLNAGESTSFRISIILQPAEALSASRRSVSMDGHYRSVQSKQFIGDELNRIRSANPVHMIREDEKVYSRIRQLPFTDKDQELTYWSSFSLLRQCMMPPEGECGYNYYVFSREPKWGWGYGGQVFHESLAMITYARMDPGGAMNSQRVFMERQQPDGYINYRTGPYLNERIETGGKPTSSAPWFNFQNLEIFKITNDRKFLKDAYLSGRRFYEYYTANRDSNQNGLCEWGAHAELESVRDARVAIWDKVGWASNFEGPDLNSMLVREALALAEMAGILGINEDKIHWKSEAKKRKELINQKLWDPVTGFYYCIDRDRQDFTHRTAGDLKIMEIIGFLPLWAGVADQEKAARLVQVLTDTAFFWRPYGIPTLTAASDYYYPIGYWNGPVWIQWNYLVYRGLKDNGYDREAKELSLRVIRNVVYHLKRDHTFWEFYSADDLQAGWNKTYIWAGMIVEMMNEIE